MTQAYGQFTLGRLAILTDGRLDVVRPVGDE